MIIRPKTVKRESDLLSKSTIADPPTVSGANSKCTGQVTSSMPNNLRKINVLKLMSFEVKIHSRRFYRPNMKDTAGRRGIAFPFFYTNASKFSPEPWPFCS